MAALDYFSERGIRLELDHSANVRAFGRLDDSLRMAIKAQKPALIAELQLQELDDLLPSLIAKFNIPRDEQTLMRELARNDLDGALECYRTMANSK